MSGRRGRRYLLGDPARRRWCTTPTTRSGESTERYIKAAARDKTFRIKQTIYRTSADSPFVPELARAAENGKAVACLVEVRARFDEMNNVERAKELEKHGVHVAYGVMGLKTHTKIALVVRREPDAPGGLRCYAHVGTGNYNSRTAELYTDLGLMTCDPEVTEDVIDLFNYLTGRSRKRDYKRLLVAPNSMRRRFVEMIDREIEIARTGGRGVIKAKMNQLEDAQIIDKLYEASCSGVKIDLIVRGFGCLRAGVPGLSENIRLVSSMGRFLEHSRIFHFGAGKDDPVEGEWYIGSADWMYRNLDYRVEAITPVLDPIARRKLHDIVEADLADHRDVWEMQPDGSFAQRTPPPDADPASPAAMGSFAYSCTRRAGSGEGLTARSPMPRGTRRSARPCLAQHREGLSDRRADRRPRQGDAQRLSDLAHAERARLCERLERSADGRRGERLDARDRAPQVEQDRQPLALVLEQVLLDRLGVVHDRIRAREREATLLGGVEQRLAARAHRRRQRAERLAPHLLDDLRRLRLHHRQRAVNSASLIAASASVLNAGVSCGRSALLLPMRDRSNHFTRNAMSNFRRSRRPPAGATTEQRDKVHDDLGQIAGPPEIVHGHLGNCRWSARPALELLGGNCLVLSFSHTPKSASSIAGVGDEKSRRLSPPSAPPGRVALSHLRPSMLKIGHVRELRRAEAGRACSATCLGVL